MTTPATKLPTWATSASVVTGPDAGLSTRLEPAAGTLASGFVADTRTSARTANWLEGGMCDWLAALAPIAYSTWTCWRCFSDSPPVPADWTSRCAPYVDSYNGFWSLPLTISGDGQRSETAKHPSPLSSSGAHLSTAVVSHSPLANADQPISVASAPAISVIGFDAYSTSKSVVLAVTANSLSGTEVVLSDNFQPIKTTYSSALGMFVAVQAGASAWFNTALYWTSTDGLTYTSRAISGFTGNLTVSSLVAGAKTGQLAVGFRNSTAMGVSTDGINWTVSARSGSSYTIGLCETASGWLALGSDGTLWRYNGTTWTSPGNIEDYPTTLGTPCDSDRKWFGNLMASDGGRAVAILTCASGRLYVKLSLDEGLTWHDVALAHNYRASGGNWIPAGITFSGGQFAAVAYGPDNATGWLGAVFFSAKM